LRNRTSWIAGTARGSAGSATLLATDSLTMSVFLPGISRRTTIRQRYSEAKPPS